MPTSNSLYALYFSTHIVTDACRHFSFMNKFCVEHIDVVVCSINLGQLFRWMCHKVVVRSVGLHEEEGIISLHAQGVRTHLIHSQLFGSCLVWNATCCCHCLGWQLRVSFCGNLECIKRFYVSHQVLFPILPKSYWQVHAASSSVLPLIHLPWPHAACRIAGLQ